MDQPGQATDSLFKRMCVFCGSSSGKKPIYTEVAEQLGNELVNRGIDLVYGGGSIGLMGKVAQTVQDAGGHVVGVIPKALMPKEICGKTVGDLIAVDDMHQRKAEMARRADAFIALPGGYGTLEEVLEIITWAQLGIHTKPVGLMNVDGYFDTLLAFFDKALDEGFLNLASRQIVVSASTASELLSKMEVYAPVEDKSVPKLTWEVTTGIATGSPSMQEKKTPVCTTPRAVMVSPLNDGFRSMNLHSRRNTKSFSEKRRISNRVCAMTLSTRATTTTITLHSVNKMQAGALCVHSCFPSSVNGVSSLGSRTAAAVSAFTAPMVLL